MHLARSIVFLDKADSPALVHTDAVLTLPVARQALEPVPWRHPQVFEGRGCIEHERFATDGPLDGNQA